MPQKLPDGQRNRTMTIPISLDEEIQEIADKNHASWTKTGVALLKEAVAARIRGPSPTYSAILQIPEKPVEVTSDSPVSRLLPPVEIPEMGRLGIYGDSLQAVSEKLRLPIDTILIDLLRKYLKDYVVQVSSEVETLRGSTGLR